MSLSNSFTSGGGQSFYKTMMIILLVTMLMVLHSGGQGSELPALLMDLPNAPDINPNNLTFFNGVFANVEGVAFFFDCLGSHFTWLQAIFTNFPALLTFVSKLKCVTDLCPRDFEDYGCACRYEMEGLPVDEADNCCFQHRKCYEEATEEDCVWDPSKITVDVSCLTKNLTCESEDRCERLLCNCDKAAIECFVHSRINSSLNSLDVSVCASLITETATEKTQATVSAVELRQQATENSPFTPVAVAEVIPQSTGDTMLRTPGAEFTPAVLQDEGLEILRGDVPSESGDLLLKTPEAGVDVPPESGDALLKTAESGDVPPESSDLLLRNAEAGDVPPESSDLLLRNAEAGEVPGDVFAVFEEAMPSGMTEKVFLPDGETTTALPPHINSIQPEVAPTSAIPGGSTDKATGNLFKIVGPGEESTTYSTFTPEDTLEPVDAFGKVCDRFTFLQLRDNGQVKREMPQLGEMLYCLTDRCPGDFELYGCYCGQEGKGHPTDDLDRCCFSHHCCLEQLKKLGCHPERNSRSEVLCFDHTPKCIGWTMCEKLMCACDKAAAECMSTAPFNESLSFPNSHMCQEDRLFCRRGAQERPSSSAGTESRTSSEEESSSEEVGVPTSTLRRAKRAAHRTRKTPSFKGEKYTETGNRF
ncbi:otoconin-90 isoform X2 [Sphaerodactylus townsendi]|uniref:otoconin-90 isoform X2 n=1 Tax=Sphaerodactylus townsendi TaxID=933632 RepID=UPI002026DCA3|nr:otoconin-90 isoform X2 [Sphaerodactylus townsendi]